MPSNFKKVKTQISPYVSLILWVLGLIGIGAFIGSFTRPGMGSWYHDLNRSPLTPPNYVFPVAWTILYGIIAFCGWYIWRSSPFPKLKTIKTLYVLQLLLNWTWTPLFFCYHLTGISLMVLVIMDVLVATLILLAHHRIQVVGDMMIPYLLWILFASYLNFHVWFYN